MIDTEEEKKREEERKDESSKDNNNNDNETNNDTIETDYQNNDGNSPSLRRQRVNERNDW